MSTSGFSRPREVILEGLSEGIFTAASVFVEIRGEPVWHEAFGRVGGPGTPEATHETRFDLASLTKVLCTTPLWILLAFRNPGILDRPIRTWFPHAPADKELVTPRLLLAHASGLPAWRPYYLYGYVKKDIRSLVLEKILSDGLEYPPGKETIYSDLGFILLGFLTEKEKARPLGQCFRDEISVPLGIEDELLFRPDQKKAPLALTRSGEAPGLVHDLTCRALGGMTGHAGLFGTARAVYRVGAEVLAALKGRLSLFEAATVREFCRRAGLVPERTRALGFDTPSPVDSTSGKYFSLQSIGHTGFTGTSLWIDPMKETIVVLLTNRVFAGEGDPRIKSFRPRFHDAIMGR
ncbi:MAG: serine hydrolase domain-containing protein [Thermodesulfobacteriota bacterium]